MKIETIIIQNVKKAIKELYSQDVEDKLIQIQPTRKDFEGDLTLVVFPFLRISKKKPEKTAEEIGLFLQNNVEEIKNYNIIKGFLNITISEIYWQNILNQAAATPEFGHKTVTPQSSTVMVEYSSPNTNKPLHLGHIRNNLLGYSVSEILKANGYNVIKVNLINDRGIHICKSMLAWQKWGNGETPESTGMKGDHLVGKYYVKFDQEYKAQIKKLVAQGITDEKAKKTAPLLLEAQEMLRKWEANDPEITKLWKQMNEWVYAGFNETYKKMGVSFDKFYYESQTYLSGKSTVIEGLKKGILIKKEDNSVWADLTNDGLDQKILLRSDGTSVYMTQDIGTAKQRFDEYQFDKLIYVVGNEQDYHFKVLSIVLDKLGFEWANKLFHLSYGMVELPQGKMKSREGTVVDADDLMKEMEETAHKTSQELGKLDGYTSEQIQEVVKTISLGALKYFILKVDPRKTMLFNPQDSIDFNGNTGPFIQYTYARIQSIKRKAAEQNIKISTQITGELALNNKEIQLIKLIYQYPETVAEAGKNFSPAMIANYTYELVKEYNQFYHDYSILKEENPKIKIFRFLLSDTIGKIIKNSMKLLGINVPDKM